MSTNQNPDLMDSDSPDYIKYGKKLDDGSIMSGGGLIVCDCDTLISEYGNYIFVIPNLELLTAIIFYKVDKCIKIINEYYDDIMWILGVKDDDVFDTIVEWDNPDENKFNLSTINVKLVPSCLVNLRYMVRAFKKRIHSILIDNYVILSIALKFGLNEYDVIMVNRGMITPTEFIELINTNGLNERVRVSDQITTLDACYLSEFGLPIRGNYELTPASIKMLSKDNMRRVLSVERQLSMHNYLSRDEIVKHIRSVVKLFDHINSFILREVIKNYDIKQDEITINDEPIKTESHFFSHFYNFSYSQKYTGIDGQQVDYDYQEHLEIIDQYLQSCLGNNLIGANLFIESLSLIKKHDVTAFYKKYKMLAKIFKFVGLKYDKKKREWVLLD